MFCLQIEPLTLNWSLVITSNQQKALYDWLKAHQESSSQPADPFGTVYQLLVFYRAAIYNWNRIYSAESARLEVQTGLGSFSDSNTEHTPPEKLDIKQMHWLSGRLRIALYASNFQRDVIHFVNEQYIAFIKLLDAQNSPKSVVYRVDRELDDNFRALENLTEWYCKGGATSMERAQAQLDGVGSACKPFEDSY